MTPTFDAESVFLMSFNERLPVFDDFGSLLTFLEVLTSSSESDISIDDRSVVSALGSSESLDDAFFIGGRPLVGELL